MNNQQRISLEPVPENAEETKLYASDRMRLQSDLVVAFAILRNEGSKSRPLWAALRNPKACNYYHQQSQTHFRLARKAKA